MNYYQSLIQSTPEFMCKILARFEVLFLENRKLSIGTKGVMKEKFIELYKSYTRDKRTTEREFLKRINE